MEKGAIETVRNLSYERNDHRVRLRRLAGTTALFFQSKLSCDVDGSPNAYHPLDDSLALDVIESAEGRRVGGGRSGPLEVLPSPDIIVYVNGAPYVCPDGPFKGFYVSATSYQNPLLPATDPGRYLDARKVQYIVLPGGLTPEAHLGDLAIVYDPISHAHAAAIFGDTGPSSESGEAAIATIQRLGLPVTDGKSSPGQMRDDLFYLVFPNTAAKVEAADGWPHAQASIDNLAEAEFNRWGGVPQIESILATDPVGGPVPDAADNSWIYDELAYFRTRKVTAPYEFGLPNRCRVGESGRLPCAPELVVACHEAADEAEKLIARVELGKAPPDTLRGLEGHLRRLGDVFRRFPVETVDELESPIREVARTAALADRVRRLLGRA
jgi:hypothetical protein